MTNPRNFFIKPRIRGIKESETKTRIVIFRVFSKVDLKNGRKIYPSIQHFKIPKKGKLTDL